VRDGQRRHDDRDEPGSEPGTMACIHINDVH
jgi:hypothetical protein